MNFDREIMKLIRESKCLHRLGIEVPDSANMVLLQEQKFKEYYAELTCAAAQTLIFIIIIVTLLVWHSGYPLGYHSGYSLLFKCRITRHWSCSILLFFKH